jgi:hypothetical protein
MGFPTINDMEIVMNWDTVTQSRYRHAAALARQRRFPHCGLARTGNACALSIETH